MNFKFFCPHCGQHIEASEEFIGSQGTCPTCFQTFVVPTPQSSSLTQTPALQQSSPSTAPQIQATMGQWTTTPQKKPPKRIMRKVAGGCTIVMCGGIIVLSITGLVSVLFKSSAPKSAILQEQQHTEEPVKITAAEQQELQTLEPLEIQPAAGIDEEYYLLRNLERLYNNWPAYDPDPDANEKHLIQYRNEVATYPAYMSHNNMDAKLQSAYTDLIALIDYYTNLLAEQGFINKQAEERITKENLETGAKAGFEAVNLEGQLEDQGKSENSAIGIAATVGIIDFLWTNYNQSKERDEAKKQALDNIQRQFKEQYSSVRGSVQALAADFATKHGLRRAETGFDDSDQDQIRLNEFADKNDVGALAQVARDKALARPHDPFAKNQAIWSDYRMMKKDTSANQLLDWARQFVDCASSVPAGSFFDEHRAWFLENAGEMALLASGYGGSTDPNPSKLAVVYWKTNLKYSSRDTDGTRRVELARALACSGNNKQARDMLQSIYELQKDVPYYNCLFAEFLSVDNDLDQSLIYLKKALNLGWTDIPSLKEDSNFAHLVSARKGGFDQLLTIKYSWDIDYGTFNDDITLNNQSEFPLTNIVFTPIIHNGDRVYNPVLKADYIAPGASKKWENCVSVAGSHADSKADTLVCAQGSLTH